MPSSYQAVLWKQESFLVQRCTLLCVMATLGVAIIWLSIAVLWILSAPAFIALVLRQWKRVNKQGASGFRAVWPAAVGFAVLMNWILFLAFAAAGQIGGVGTHSLTPPLSVWFLLLPFLF